MKGEVATLFILDTNKINLKTAILYAGLAVFVYLFSVIYGFFSHEVYSYFLTFAFVFPLSGGIICLVFSFTKYFCKWPYNFMNAGLATMTIGSILRGINDVAGADTKYYLLFLLVGLIWCIISFITLITSLIIKLYKGRKQQ